MKTLWALIIFLCIIGSVENKKLQKSFEEIFVDGWHLKEEANLAQIIAQENEQQNESNHGMIDGTDQNEEEEENDRQKQRKMEIIGKFRAVKEKIKQKKGKQSRKEWNKIDCLLAKKLGTNQFNIYKWISELGMGMRKQLIFTEEQKREIVGEFRATKEQIKQQKGKYTREKWYQFECDIAKKLGTSRCKIYKWIGELGMKKQKIYTEEQKRKIVQEFLTIKEGMKQKGKLSSKEWKEIDKSLARKLGTNRDNIYKWSREFRIGKKRTNEHRMALMTEYWEMKRNDPKMSDRKITKTLKIGRESIRRWKDQFREGTGDAI